MVLAGRSSATHGIPRASFQEQRWSLATNWQQLSCVWSPWTTTGRFTSSILPGSVDENTHLLLADPG